MLLHYIVLYYIILYYIILYYIILYYIILYYIILYYIILYYIILYYIILYYIILYYIILYYIILYYIILYYIILYSVNFVGRGRSQRGWCPLDRLPLRQYSEWGSTGEPFFYETYFPEQREFCRQGSIAARLVPSRPSAFAPV